MALEAQDAVVRLLMKGGTEFQAEAERSAAAVKGVGDAAEEANAKADVSSKGSLFGFPRQQYGRQESEKDGY